MKNSVFFEPDFDGVVHSSVANKCQLVGADAFQNRGGGCKQRNS